MRICRIDLDSRSLSRGGALGQRKRAKNVNMGKGTGKSREHDVDEYERQLESVLHRPAGKGCTHEMAANEVMRSLEARVDQLHWHKHPTYHATPVAPPAEPIGKVHPPPPPPSNADSKMYVFQQEPAATTSIEDAPPALTKHFEVPPLPLTRAKFPSSHDGRPSSPAKHARPDRSCLSAFSPLTARCVLRVRLSLCLCP